MLQEGDILSIDCGAIVEGWHGDAAVTVPVGQVDDAARRLIETTERALWAGIAQVRAGNRLSDIGHAVEKVAAPGYGVVREYVGHRHPHARGAPGPQLRPPRPRPPPGDRPRPGHRAHGQRGRPLSRVLDDGWTVVTLDGPRSAHFEHTVAITPKGPRSHPPTACPPEHWLPAAAMTSRSPRSPLLGGAHAGRSFRRQPQLRYP